jgi:hypothetical protein
MMILLALLFNVAGFFGLAAANPRYREALLGRKPEPPYRRATRFLAIVFIGLSLTTVWAACGAPTGIVMFAGVSMVGAITSVLCVTMGRWFRRR